MRGLTWQDERYVRTWTRDTPDWMLLGWKAQGLYHSLRRKADRAGLIQLGRAGRRGVAALVNGAADMDEVLDTLDELEGDGWVEVRGDVLIIPEFIESEEAVMTNVARQRAHRERARDQALAGAREEPTPVTPARNAKVERQRVTPVRNAKRSRQGVTPSEPSFRAVPSEKIQIPPDPAASALDLSKPHARAPEPTDDDIDTREPLDADDPPPFHPKQLANYARYGIPVTLPGETKAQGKARRHAALVAGLEADAALADALDAAQGKPKPGSSQQGGEEDHDDPDPPSGRPVAPPADHPALAQEPPASAPATPATGVGTHDAPPALGAALAGPGQHVPVAGEVWPPPAGWIPGPGSLLPTCGACSMGRRYPEELLCPCPLGIGEGKRRQNVASLDAQEARERAVEAQRREARRAVPPLFGPETPSEQAALTAPDTTPLGKLGLASLLPPPGYGAKVPDDPAALILATLERQPEPLRHLAEPGVCSRLAGAVMGTKATVAQIEDAIRMASSKLPAELGNVRADNPQGLDRVQRWLAGCLKGCRSQGHGRAAPHDPSEALPVVTRRILTRFAAAYLDREGIDYLAGEEDPAHAEAVAAHLKRQVEAAAAKAGAAPDAALGGAMLDQLLETWMASKMGEATGYALAQLAGALRREPARWAYRPPPPDPYAGVRVDTSLPVGPRPPVEPRQPKPRPELAPIVELFARKRATA